MGKWSFMGVDMRKNRKAYQHVIMMSDEEVNKRYEELNVDGAAAFKLICFSNSANDDRWPCIDNSAHPDHQKVPVQFWCDSAQMSADASGHYYQMCIKRATIMADDAGLRNVLIEPDPEPYPQAVALSKTIHVFKSMDDRQLGDLVNDLTAIGKEYGQSQQLRARILGKLSEAIESSNKVEQKMSLAVNKDQIILTDVSI